MCTSCCASTAPPGWSATGGGAVVDSARPTTLGRARTATPANGNKRARLRAFAAFQLPRATRRYRCSDTDNVSIKVSVVLGTVYAALNSRSRWLFR
jgi:hypothetical protein